MISSTTQLNTPGALVSEFEGVHAITDVTGFGLAGHCLELAKGSGLSAVIHWPSVPLLPEVLNLAKQGFLTGASGRNWEAYGHQITVPETFSQVEQALLSDPQTSGGLLISCTPEAAPAVLQCMKQEGFEAAVIGECRPGPAGVSVTL